MKTAGILFDYNGVLVNDEQLHKQAFQKVLDGYGVSFTDELYDRACLGRTDEDGFKYLAREFNSQLGGVPIDKLLKSKIEQYGKLAGQTDILYPGAEKTIRELEKKYRLAIVTSSTRDEVLPFLSSKKLISIFDFILTAEDITRGKLNPESYLTGLNRLKLPPQKVVVVEDSPSGVKAANSANLACIAVLHSVPREQLRGTDKILEKISDLNEEVIENVLYKRPGKT